MKRLLVYRPWATPNQRRQYLSTTDTWSFWDQQNTTSTLPINYKTRITVSRRQEAVYWASRVLNSISSKESHLWGQLWHRCSISLSQGGRLGIQARHPQWWRPKVPMICWKTYKRVLFTLGSWNLYLLTKLCLRTTWWPTTSSTEVMPSEVVWSTATKSFSASSKTKTNW